SSDSAVSSLDSSVIRSSTDLTTIMSRDLGAATAVDASTLNLTFGSDGWDNTKGTEGAGTGSESGTTTGTGLPSGTNTAHDWVLSNTTVQSEGNVTLKGIGFSNSTLNITGALNLSSDKWLTLRGDTLNATGGTTLCGTQGVQLADLTNNSPLTVTAPELAVSYQSGTLSNATLNVSGNTTMSGQQNLTLSNVTLNGGNLSMQGNQLTLNSSTLNATDNLVLSTQGDLSLSNATLLQNGTGNTTLTSAGNLT
ncbi:hypothetical protein DO659_26280, partial [Salmonella enterica subsp. enterica serovar Minnesota]|nr:hypothetical protein [Salmonella enterica subsp. enterica serovar Minnesota]